MMQITRLMVIMDHNLWAITLVALVGVGALIAGSQIRNRYGRNVVLGIGIITMAFHMATGASVAPLDHWQHQHGTCLLESLEQGKR